MINTTFNKTLNQHIGGTVQPKMSLKNYDNLVSDDGGGWTTTIGCP